MPSYAQIAAMFPSTYSETKYAWIITRDFLFEDDEFCTHPEMFYDEDNDYVCTECFGQSEAGTRGPCEATEVQIALANACGHRFRIYDDDDILYYEGYIWIANGQYDSEVAFTPLDDFGTPNAGATDIKYLYGCTWIGL